MASAAICNSGDGVLEKEKKREREREREREEKV